MKIIDNIEQGSHDWLMCRLGKVTGTGFSKVISNGRGGAISKTSQTYMVELLAEILRGEPSPFFMNDAMRWGSDTEPQARAMYELRHGVDVRQVAFIEHNDFVGVSPDGLVGDDGMIEIKCPDTKTQIVRYLDSIGLPSDYEAQVQGQLWVSEREWCDFVSFDPRIDVDASYIETRVYRDEDYIKRLESKVSDFVDELHTKLKVLTDG
jgi:putative phage-type endonuclease